MPGKSPSRSRAGRLVVLQGAGRGAGRKASKPGVVWLVGAGPGDPDLLTVKALRLLQGADVVVHDRLTPELILDLAGPGARLIDVGKRKSRHALPQEGINDLLVGLAREGLTVVRLKGGDPFVFGRGGEEMLACRAAGVACHVVPGVSAGLAAGASAGAPLTHRGLAQSVTFVTGHAAAGGEPDLDWTSLARGNQTLVIYMGLTTAARIAGRLIEAGRAPGTPALVVESASLPHERRVLTTLVGLGEAVAGMDGPAVLILGETAALAQSDCAALEADTVKAFPEFPSPLEGEGSREGGRAGLGSLDRKARSSGEAKAANAGAAPHPAGVRSPPSPSRGEGPSIHRRSCEAEASFSSDKRQLA